MATSLDSALPPNEQDSSPSVDERLALVERVAASEQFKRAARLRDFLLYVGRQSLKEGSHEIHEQEIGAHVFGRPSNYDRSQDNIVRVNATELRKRIELYFSTEGIHEPLVLEIPRGGYVPIFHWREVADLDSATLTVAENRAEVPMPELLRPDNAVEIKKSNKKAHSVWATICLLLLVGSLLLLRQNLAMRAALYPWNEKPALATFWNGFFNNHQQTDIVLPDDSASLIEDITHEPISLSDYLNYNYMREIQSSNFSDDRKHDLNEVFGHNMVTFGGVRAAQHVIMHTPVSIDGNLVLARFYEADAIKHDNVVLIGGEKANPWVHLFDDQMNFITSYDYDNDRSHAFVGNKSPRAGEQAVYTPIYTAAGNFGYSVLAYMPNPSHTGNAIILAGTDSDATDAAAEFLSSEEQMEKFRNLLHVRKFPYFEILLKTARINGTSLGAEMVAYRTH